jgi:hypothetical protein
VALFGDQLDHGNDSCQIYGLAGIVRSTGVFEVDMKLQVEIQGRGHRDVEDRTTVTRGRSAVADAVVSRVFVEESLDSKL